MTKKEAEYGRLVARYAKLRQQVLAAAARLVELRGELGPATVDGNYLIETEAGTLVRAERLFARTDDQWRLRRRRPPRALADVIDIVRSAGHATNASVAKVLNIPMHQATLRLTRAAKEGFLVRVAQGVYELDAS